MFWSSREDSTDGTENVANFLLVDRVPSRGHRTAISDDEFREIGVISAMRPTYEYVVLLHFADEFGWNATSL